MGNSSSSLVVWVDVVDIVVVTEVVVVVVGEVVGVIAQPITSSGLPPDEPMVSRGQSS